MTKLKRKKDETHPINFILLAISLLVFGILGIAFITQMELVPGWMFGSREENSPIQYGAQLIDDITGDGIPDLVARADVRYCHREGCSNSPHFGGVYTINGKSGELINKTEFDNPVRNLFPITDINNDGVNDYLVDIAKVKDEWILQNENESDSMRVDVIPNNFSNFFIDGRDLDEINIETGDFVNITNNYIHKVISLDDLTDDVPDFIFLEAQFSYPLDSYLLNLTSYYVNGTMVDSFFVGDFHLEREGDFITPSFELFNYFSGKQLLFVSNNYITVFNTSSEAFLSPIYTTFIPIGAEHYGIIEDINSDGISEIVTTSWNGNVSIFNGADGSLIQSFQGELSEGNLGFSVIPSIEDGEAYILVTKNDYDNREFRAYIYNMTETNISEQWFYTEIYEDNNPRIYILEEDFDGDSIFELLLTNEYIPMFSQNNVQRFHIISFPTNNELSVLNIDYHPNHITTINDFDGDGLKDYIVDGDMVAALSSSKPTGIWLSPAFPLGFPLFIILCACVIVGIAILARNFRRIKISRERIKKTRLAVSVNIIVIALMTISIILFLMQLNIFNRTLITGDNMTSITVIYLSITIIWYGLLPLTAAIYNGFAPQFAYMFVKLREAFFKISKKYDHDILVENMNDRQDLSTIVRLKRIILPLLLSIAVAFYSYNTLAPLLGYPQGFDTFGSSQFFEFIIGYNLLCLLPMILTFLIFSFFISGNFLLDDAGIIYYLKPKTHRRPGDVEPISIWAQSIIKGIAGISALITFSSFLSTVDFSGFFNTGEGGGIISFIFGFFLVVVMFWGTPFLTAFAYILFSLEAMDFSLDFNKEKLYYFMQEGGYDTTPRDLTALYPERTKPFKEPSNNV